MKRFEQYSNNTELTVIVHAACKHAYLLGISSWSENVLTPYKLFCCCSCLLAELLYTSLSQCNQLEGCLKCLLTLP